MMGLGIGLGLGLFLFLGLLGIGILAFEVWMFVDAIMNDRLDDTQKLLWCVGMVLIHPFVAIAYYVVVYTKRSK
jgi:hypothetical protein